MSESDARLPAIPDIHGHAKGEHKPYADERPIPYSARLIFLWFYHAALRRSPRFVMVTDHVNYLTFEDPAAVSLVRRALKLALAGDLYGASETANVDISHALVVSEAMRAGMRFSIGAEVDNDPRSRPDAQNVVDAMKPDGIIRSVHFLPIAHPETGEEWIWPFDNPEFIPYFERVGVEETWRHYTDLMVDVVKTLPGDILGHLHVPGKFGHWPEESTLEACEDRILDACAERGMAVEINARIFYRSSNPAVHARHIELYRRLLRKCVERELPIAIGSDAHSPKDQGRGIDCILPLLDEQEINEIVFPVNGVLARVLLRADRPLRSRPSIVSQPARQATPPERETTDPLPPPLPAELPEAVEVPPESESPAEPSTAKVVKRTSKKAVAKKADSSKPAVPAKKAAKKEPEKLA
jgi:HisJ family histidinol phosphate phosphatase